MKISVLLVHQQVSLESIEQFSLASDQPYVLVTTHEYFPSETLQFARFQKAPLAIVRDRDLIQEEDFELIDSLVCEEFARSGRSFAHSKEMNDSMLSHRAYIIRSRLHTRFGTELKFYHGEGLGIASVWWLSQGSTPLARTESVTPPKIGRSLFRSIHLRFKRSRGWSQIVTSSGKVIVIGGRLARISHRFHSSFSIRPATFLQRIRFGFPEFFRGKQGVFGFASPVHDYDPSVYRPTLVLQDGHLPRDYSKGIFHCYSSSDRHVPSNPFSEQWIRRAGLDPYRLPGFSDPDFSLPVRGASRIINVLLALGHGGDWSPFIHRSDTDRMLIEFIRMASSNPGLNFRVRPHPTMVHPFHEGAGSLERIRREIVSITLPNLEISNSPIDEDLSWAGVVVSEYSQVLIESWRAGKLGIVFNPTERRSFLKEFEELGFPAALSIEEIIRMTESGDTLVDRQIDSTRKYNQMMEQWRLRTD